MRIAVDTSVIIAVIADEPERLKIIEITKDSTICSTYYKMGSWKRILSHDEKS